MIEEQIIARKVHREQYYSNRLKSRITLKIARSEIRCEILDSIVYEHSCGMFSYRCPVSGRILGGKLNVVLSQVVSSQFNVVVGK